MNDYIHNTCSNVKNSYASYDISHAAAANTDSSQSHNSDSAAPIRLPYNNQPPDLKADSFNTKYNQLYEIKASNAKKLKIALTAFIITALILIGLCILQIVNIHSHVMQQPEYKISNAQINTDFNGSNDGWTTKTTESI